MTAPVLFTAADIAEMRAFNEANLPDSVALRHGSQVYEPGGTRGPVVWDLNPTWTEPCRVSPASPPQEQLTAGSLSEVKDFFLVTREGVAIPSNYVALDGTAHFYRLEWVHGITGLTSPFLLYLRGTPLRSYRMLSKFLCHTVAPQ